MIHNKKALTVRVLKTPDGKFNVTDPFGKVEVMSLEDFTKYVERSKPVAPETLNTNVKNTIVSALAFLHHGEVEEAIELLEQLT